jgi:hypothetical protein
MASGRCADRALLPDIDASLRRDIEPDLPAAFRAL